MYPTKEGPRYIRGHAVTLSLVGFGIVLLGGMSAYFSAENRKRIQGVEDEKISGMTDDEIEELGDRNPRFLYTV